MKRFIETTRWRDPWFRRLSGASKHLWQWLLDHCDNAGVIDLDIEAASFDIGEPINEKHLGEISSRLKTFPNGKIWIPKFVAFQYGELSTACRPHAQVIRLLDSHGLDYTLLEGYAKGIYTLKDKDKDKDKDQDKEKEEGVQGENSKPKLPQSPEKNFPEAETPSWGEWWGYCKGVGMAEWYAKDKFLAAEQDFWKSKANWRAYATRCFTWWVAEGRPKERQKPRSAKSASDGAAPLIDGSNSYTICPGNDGVPGALPPPPSWSAARKQ